MNFKNIITHSFVSLIFILTVGCSKDIERPKPFPELEVDKVVIAYLAGDNNLSVEIEQKIEAMRKGMMKNLEDRSKLLIFSDQSGKDKTPELIEVTKWGIKKIKKYNELNLADKNVLKMAIRDVINIYNVQSYGLVVFSHGTAWMPANGMRNPYEQQNSTTIEKNISRSVIIDNDDEMSIPDFAEAITLPKGKKFEFIVFENCYMASVEVAYELKNKTDYIVSSATEIVSPGMLEVYESSIWMLLKKHSDLVGFAKAYFDLWNNKKGEYRSATISVTNSSSMDKLAQYCKKYIVNADTINDKSKLQYFNRNLNKYFFDLEQVVNSVDPKTRFELSKILKEAIIYKNNTPYFLEGGEKGFKIENHCGLMLYIINPKFNYVNKSYYELKWYNDLYSPIQKKYRTELLYQ